MSKLTIKQWQQIKADYQADGVGFSELERRYKVAKSTIATRAKKENWQRNKYEQKINNVISGLSEITEKATEQEISIIKPKIENSVDLLLSCANSFITKACKMNVELLDELQNEDVKTKIIGLSSLKATMPELVKLVGLQKETITAEAESNDNTATINYVGCTDIINATPEEVEAKYHALVKEGKITKYRITDEMSAIEASRIYQEFINVGKDD